MLKISTVIFFGGSQKISRKKSMSPNQRIFPSKNPDPPPFQSAPLNVDRWIVLLKKMEICKDQAFHFQSHLNRGLRIFVVPWSRWKKVKLKNIILPTRFFPVTFSGVKLVTSIWAIKRSRLEEAGNGALNW